MKKWNYFFTSECVTQWHPDKVCDQVSDAILDECFKQDPYSRVAVECLITDKKLVIAWEVTTKAQFSYEEVARKVLSDIWYSTQESWFDVKNSEIEVLVHTQSPDISQW
jgi:S-adenosylmethionine synthetase